MKSNKIFPFLIIVVLPVVFASALPFFFKLQIFTDPQQTASIMAMILLPFSEGLLLVAASSLNSVSRPSYRIFMPWLAILLFFIVTFLFKLEDCACWIIGLPLYLLLSSVGGLTAGYVKLKNRVDQVSDI